MKRPNLLICSRMGQVTGCGCSRTEMADLRPPSFVAVACSGCRSHVNSIPCVRHTELHALHCAWKRLTSRRRWPSPLLVI